MYVGYGFSNFLICSFHGLDQYIQFIPPTICTLLAIYKYYRRISDIFTQNKILYVLPEDGTLVPKHVGNKPLIFVYNFNTVHIFGEIN